MPKPVLLDYMDAEEVAASICNVESEESSEIEDALIKKYDVSFDQYNNILSDVFERLDFAISPITQSAFIGISNKEKNTWLAKIDISQKFISGVIEWLTGGEKIKPKAKGFSRVITNKGINEFEIIIRNANK